MKNTSEKLMLNGKWMHENTSSFKIENLDLICQTNEFEPPLSKIWNDIAEFFFFLDNYSRK